MMATMNPQVQNWLQQKGWSPPQSRMDQFHQQMTPQHLQQQLPMGYQGTYAQGPTTTYGQALPQQYDMTKPLTGRPIVQNYGEKVQESSALYHNLAMSVDPSVNRNLYQHAMEVQQNQYSHDLHQLRLAGDNRAPVNRLPAEQFLRTTFIEGKVLQRVAPQLIFLNMATRFTTDAIDIVWFRHNFSPDTDPLARQPVPIGEDGRFPRAEIADPVKKMGSVGMWGLAVEFTRQALKHTNTAVDDVQRKIDWSAWKMAQKINTVYGNALTNFFSTVQTGPDAVITQQAGLPWDDEEANPLRDLRDLALKMKTENGHYFQPTEVWINPEQMRELMDYADTVDHHWATSPINNAGVQTVRDLDGIQIREAPPASGIPDGFMIMLAANTGSAFGLPLTVWEAVDPEFTRSGIMHVDRFRHPETKRETVLMWKEFFVANRNPKAVGMVHTA